jgi:hypothetical protein
MRFHAVTSALRGQMFSPLAPPVAHVKYSNANVTACVVNVSVAGGPPAAQPVTETEKVFVP